MNGKIQHQTQDYLYNFLSFTLAPEDQARNGEWPNEQSLSSISVLPMDADGMYKDNCNKFIEKL